MATKRTNSPRDIYQIKVTLLGTKPPIWRRLVVPASMSLAKLHDVLQTAMGWHDCHMHEFRAGDRHFGNRIPKTSTWECPRSKTSAPSNSAACSGGQAPR